LELNKKIEVFEKRRKNESVPSLKFNGKQAGNEKAPSIGKIKRQKTIKEQEWQSRNFQRSRE
jgi:hypothetical protein